MIERLNLIISFLSLSVFFFSIHSFFFYFPPLFYSFVLIVVTWSLLNFLFHHGLSTIQFQSALHACLPFVLLPHLHFTVNSCFLNNILYVSKKVASLIHPPTIFCIFHDISSSTDSICSISIVHPLVSPSVHGFIASVCPVCWSVRKSKAFFVYIRQLNSSLMRF